MKYLKNSINIIFKSFYKTQNFKTMKNLFYLLLLTITPIYLAAQTDGLHVVSPDGYVGVGTETPSEKLEVVGNTKTQGAIIENQGGSASVSCEKITKAAFAFGAGTHGGFTVDKNYHLEFRSNTRGRVLGRYITEGDLLLRFKKITGYAGFGGITSPTTSIHTSGSITYNGALFNASDQRLKKNIVDMNYGLKEVLQLNPISYQYNGKGGIKNIDRKQYGLKAQELQKVAPELVSTFIHEIEDKETKVIDSEEYLMIEESAIKYMLMNAIQEQQAQIESLKSDIQKLEKSNKSDIGFTETGLIKDQAILKQNIPNPFSKITRIEYHLPESSKTANIKVFNLTGKELKSFELINKGDSQIELNLSDLSNGMYIYSLVVDGQIVESKQMILE